MNWFSFFARLKYADSSSDGANDLSKLISSNKYRPLKVRTLESTVYSQFLKSPPLGHDVIITMSLDMPCSLWSVVALFRFTGNWCIRHLNSNCVVAIWWGLTLTVTLFVCGFILNRLVWLMFSTFSWSWCIFYWRSLLISSSSVEDNLMCMDSISFDISFMGSVLTTCSTSIHSTSFAHTVQTFRL